VRFVESSLFGMLSAHILPEKALWLPDLRWLVLADLHFGKVNHFRRNGLPVPIRANEANTERLMQLLIHYKPEQVLFLGDLFHSHYNSEWEVVGKITEAFPESHFVLVSGNHDILSDHEYQRHRIEVVAERQSEGAPGIIFRHDPLPDEAVTGFQVCGHIHPSVTLSGKGLPSETFPCFWFGKKTALLPAFGVFTGTKRIHPQPGDEVFAVAAGKVWPVRTEK